MKKLIEDKYTQPIFLPNDLYVLKNYTDEYVMNTYEWSDGCEITKEDLKPCKGETLYPVCRKDDKTNKILTIVLLDTHNFSKVDREDDAINVCSHEAAHVVHDMLEHCSMKLSYDTSEVFAYLIGWVTSCIWKTYKKKSNE